MVEQSAEWWVAIAHSFTAHVRDEVVILDAYEKLAARTKDPGTRYVLRLILDDERRHHDLFQQLDAVTHPGETMAAVPDAPSPPAEERGELIIETQRFLDIERQDRAALRQLRRELKPSAQDTLWRLLIELMEIDTQKHIRILEYLRKRLRSLD